MRKEKNIYKNRKMIDQRISIQGAMLQPLRVYAMKLLSRIKIILYKKG